MPLFFFPETVFLNFQCRLFFLESLFRFFGKARGAKPPITFCELARAADLPPTSSSSEAARLARALLADAGSGCRPRAVEPFVETDVADNVNTGRIESE